MTGTSALTEGCNLVFRLPRDLGEITAIAIAFVTCGLPSDLAGKSPGVFPKASSFLKDRIEELGTRFILDSYPLTDHD
jgi:hypothetical protein